MQVNPAACLQTDRQTRVHDNSPAQPAQLSTPVPPPASPPCPPQIKRAQECEANTGPAQRPDLSAAAGAGGEGGAGGEQEEDPLDAFMAEIGQMEKAQEGQPAGGRPRQERMEAEDTVEAFVQVRGHACTACVHCVCVVDVHSVRGAPKGSPGELWGRSGELLGALAYLPSPAQPAQARNPACPPTSRPARPASAASSTPHLWRRRLRAAGTAVTTRACGAWRRRWMPPRARQARATIPTTLVS